MVNVAAISRTIDLLRREADLAVRFDMSTFWSAEARREVPRLANHCGTVGCIAGFVVLAEYGVQAFLDRSWPGPTSVPSQAGDILGVSLDVRDALFLPEAVELRAVTPKAAITALIILQESRSASSDRQAFKLLKYWAGVGAAQRREVGA